MTDARYVVGYPDGAYIGPHLYPVHSLVDARRYSKDEAEHEASKRARERAKAILLKPSLKPYSEMTASDRAEADLAGYPRTRYPDDYWRWSFDENGRCNGVRDNGETLKEFFSVPRKTTKRR
jgi:hypothetical protein